MTHPRQQTLHRFVYRTLTLRLLLMAFLISVLTGGAVYFLEQQNLQQQVVDDARAALQQLVARSAAIIESSGLNEQAAFLQALDERQAMKIKPKEGDFVYASFFSREHQRVEERLASDYPLIDAVTRFARALPREGLTDGQTVATVRLDGRLHIVLAMPILSPAGKIEGYSQGIFALSEAARMLSQRKLQRSITLAIFAVLVTSALLYPVVLRLFHRLTLFSRNLLEANLSTLSLLASAIAKRDSDTDVHNFRVSLYAVRLAEHIGVPTDALQSLVKGAFLHDVGKIGVRDDILLKAGQLDEEEFALMQEHVRHGLEIISTSAWLQDAAAIVGGHHEKYDGSGYPQGLAREAIPLAARIFAIADVFDALTSARPYKKALSLDQALAILHKGRGSHFDPALLDAFVPLAQELYAAYAMRDDQGLRDELKALITRIFSEGAILLE